MSAAGSEGWELVRPPGDGERGDAERGLGCEGDARCAWVVAARRLTSAVPAVRSSVLPVRVKWAQVHKMMSPEPDTWTTRA